MAGPKYQLFLVAEERTGKVSGRIIEEVVIGEFETVEEVEEAFDNCAETLGLEEVGEDEE